MNIALAFVASAIVTLLGLAIASLRIDTRVLASKMHPGIISGVAVSMSLAISGKLDWTLLIVGALGALAAQMLFSYMVLKPK